jgi:hypothetical protein
VSDHLTELLLAGAAGTSEGGYNNFDAWSTTLRGDDADSAGAHLVTAHEALHAVLNDTTAHGMALAAYAVLARHAGGQHGAALRRLVDTCRDVHESFATFGSLWLVGGGDVALLRNYTDYLDWYRNASDLVPDLPDHDRRKELMIDAAVRVCMQSKGLERLLDAGLAADAWRTLAGPDRPADRFARLFGSADAGFWEAAWSECAEALRGTPAFDALEAAQQDPALRPETYDGRYADAWQTCAELLHARVAGLLRPWATTLTYDGHRGLIEPLIERVEQLAPHTSGLLVASTDERTVEDESFEMWRRERLVVRDAPRAARVARLEDLRRPEHVRLLTASGPDTYVFCAVRPAFRLLDQFAFDDADAAWLAGQGGVPVVATRSADPGSGPVDMVVVGDPDQLSTIIGSAPGKVDVYANVSLRCFADDQWRRRWSEPLLRTRLSALFDLSPFQQFDLWRREGDEVRYAVGSIRDQDRSPADLLVFRVGGGQFPILLPCSAVTGHVLRRYLGEHFTEAIEDPGVVNDDRDLIGRTVSHLLSEETSFDVSAYPQVRPASAEEP